jgi:hypothetical protein
MPCDSRPETEANQFMGMQLGALGTVWERERRNSEVGEAQGKGKLLERAIEEGLDQLIASASVAPRQDRRKEGRRCGLGAVYSCSCRRLVWSGQSFECV